MLDRKHVTRASRIMLPFYVVFDLALGATWMLQDESRTNPSLQSLRNVWPLHGTSAVLFALAGLLVLGLIARKRIVVGIALAAGAVFYLMLAIIFCIPIITSVQASWPFFELGDRTASLSAPYWPMMPAIAQVASMVTVAFEERAGTRGVWE